MPPMTRTVTVSEVQPSPATHMPIIGMNLQAAIPQAPPQMPAAVPMQYQPAPPAVRHEEQRMPSQKHEPSKEDSDESKSGIIII